jgi:hypothetical protein
MQLAEATVTPYRSDLITLHPVQDAISGGSIRMKTIIGLASLTLAISIAPAEAIDLTCSGVMHTYGPPHIEGTVQPGATIVDSEKRTITSPVGDFHITNVSDGSISFDKPAEKQLVVFGTLDRMSGLMRVFWQNPGDKTKLVMLTELKCSTAKRLF